MAQNSAGGHGFHLLVDKTENLDDTVLAGPHYCPYEMLLAWLSSKSVTETTLAYYRQRLQDAHSRGTWQQELRPIHSVLSSLRSKLGRFDLAIANVRGRGYHLTGLQYPFLAQRSEVGSEE